MKESKKFLAVSECFYSMQGEGQTMGIPAVFVRLTGCNLLCKSDQWECDTIEVWQKGKKKKFPEVLDGQKVKRLSEGAHLVFTGGEPLLQQDRINAYLHWFHSTYKFFPIIEVETNGTVIPKDKFASQVNYWNVSPKLENSGEPYERRVNAVALQKLEYLKCKSGVSVIYKFVIQNEVDILDMMQDYQEHVSFSSIVLMPAGETQEKLDKTRAVVAEQAIRLGMRYCDRLHIVIWNQKTGV